MPPAPSTIDLSWSAPTGTGEILYDVLIDGIPVITDIDSNNYSVGFPCGETHTWTIIAHNTCASEYFFCECDTLGDSTYIYLGPETVHYAVCTDSGRIFHTYPCGGPVPSIIRPLDGTFSACDPESIIIQIDDTSGIVEATIELEVDGTSYTTSHAFLTFYPPNTLVFAPGAGFWSDGDIVDVALLHAENAYGVDIASPLSWSFTIDYSPPTFSSFTPPTGGYGPGFITSVGFHTEDALSGVDSELVCLWISDDGATYCVGDPCVTWDDAAGDFTLDLTCAGYDFERGDTITFCAIAGDSPDYCEANMDTSCWDIYIIDCALVVEIDMDDTIICDAFDTVFMDMSAVILSPGLEPYSYSWSPAAIFDDDTLPDVTATLVAPAIYTITLQVTDSTGCSSIDTVTIAMSAPIADAGGDIWVCPDGIGTVGCPPVLSGYPIAPVTYTWTDLDGSVVSTDSIFDVTPESTITYVLEIIDSVGCTAYDTVVVHYEHEAPGPFSWVSPDSDATVPVGTVELCWEMPDGTTPIYFDVYVDSVLVAEGITDTCYTVGPFPCGETHWWFIESYNWCYPIDCNGDTVWVWDPFDSSFTGVFVPGDTFAGGSDPPFHTTPCPTAWPELIRPFDGACTSCEDQDIIIEIDQPDSGLSLLESSIILEVESTPYTVDGTILIWSDPNLTFIPPVFWSDGQEVDFCLTQAFDEDSNTVNDLPFCGHFYVDLSPPVPVVVTPPLVDQTSSPATFEFTLTDAGCGGIDEIIAFVGTAPGPYTPYTVDGSILFWSDPTLTFDAAAAGLTWLPGDSIVFDIIAADLPDTQYCPPNVDTTHFAWFVRDPNAPVPTVITPASGEDYTACDPDSLVIEIIDPDGVVETTIELEVDGIAYTTLDAQLDWNAPYLVFHAIPPWTDGTVVTFRLLHAEDTFGNDIMPMSVTVLTVDLSAPDADMTLPPPSSMTRDINQDIGIEITDPLSGVDETLLELTVNGQTFTETDFVWTPDGSGGGTIMFYPEINGMTFIAGDTVFVSLDVFDSPDRCAPNFDNFEWIFFIEPEITCAVFPNPFTPNTDTYNDEAFFNYPNMLSENATVIVYDIRNVEVWRCEAPPLEDLLDANRCIWDGRDNENQPVKPGLYLYIIKIGNEVVCNGTVLLLR